jgi:flagellar biosynthesis protein FlhA
LPDWPVPTVAGNGSLTRLPSAASVQTAGLDVARRLLGAARGGDIALALGVVAILVMLILPLPRWLLDISLAFSMTFSVLILMTALFIEKPLAFSAFPTVLLLATMVRLALNLASTRLILANGHEGPAAAGHVIEAFGGFVMGDNFVIGIIVFAILAIVNFVVITKGSGRIAEVSARFTLDAMPGKQMAVDADLSAGLINEVEAKQRRRELEGESSFYGAMDGAAKFVRGDAIAGLLITFINAVGGVIIGVTQQGMRFDAALDAYMRLTVGDGLVTQVPALIVSTAAGMIVTKASVAERTEKALGIQLGGHPKALAMSSLLLAALAALPGVPVLPFLLLSTVTGVLAWHVDRERRRRDQADEVATAEGAAVAPEEPIAAALNLDLIRLELGYGLLGLLNGNDPGHRLTDQIRALRRQLAQDIGFVMPSVRIQDNMQLAANSYVIRIKEIQAGEGDLRPTMLLAMDPRGEDLGLPGEKTREPTFGLPALWIDAGLREEAMFRGFTVVDPSTVITTHLTELVKDNLAELLSYAETQKLLDELPKDHQKLVGDLVPGRIALGGVQRVLQNLLAERVSIRDLPTILEGIAEACGHTRNVTAITEHVRARLARQISAMAANEHGVIPVLTLSPEWEQAFADSLIGNGDERQLVMPPSRLQEFIGAVRTGCDRTAALGETPVLLTSPAIRPFVRSIIERVRSSLIVLSQNEVFAKARLKTVGQV